MANNYRDIDKDELWQKAVEYCDNCIHSTKKVTASYKIVELPERHIPTIGYFINHWLRQNDFEFYCRAHWYDVRNDETHPLSDTIKKIDLMFKDLAEDIVANEGKGIFYAKNRLGMRNEPKDDDKPQEKIQIEIINGKGDIKND